MSNVGNIDVQIRADISNLQNNLRTMQNQLSQATSNIHSQTQGIANSFRVMSQGIAASIATYVGYKGVNLLTNGIADTIKTFNQFESANLGLKSILEAQGKSFSDAKGFIDEYINDGLVPLSNAVTAYKSLAARGYSDQQIKDTLTRLKDAAAFGRQSSLSIGDAVSGAAEGLKNENSMLVDNAGITKNVAKMWDEYAVSIGTTAQKLTQQQKVQAEVNGIMKESQFQVGDAARYSGTLGGQLSALGAQFTMLKGSIGAIFAPALQAVMPMITEAIVKFTVLANTLASFSKAIFGSNTNQKATTKSAVEMAKAENKVADGVKKAGKAVADNLQSFDELHTLQKATADAASDVAGAGGGVTSTTSTNTDPSEETSAVDSLVTKLNDLKAGAQQIFDVFNQTFGSSVVESIGKIAASVSNFKGHLEGLLSSTWTPFKQGVLDYLETHSFSGNIQILNQAIVNIGNTVSGVYDGFSRLIGIMNIVNFGQSDVIAASITKLIEGVMELGTDFIYLGTTVPKDVVEIFNKVIDRSTDLFNNSYTTAVQLATSMTSGLGSIFKTTGEGMKKVYDDNIAPLKEGFMTIWGTISDLFNSLVLNVINPILLPAFKSISDTVETIMPKIWASISKAFGSAIELVMGFWTETLKPVIDWISQDILPELKPAMEEIGKVFTDVFSSALAIVGNLFDAFTGLMKFLLGSFTGDWDKCWSGVKTIFENVFKGLFNIARIPLNSLIRGLNSISTNSGFGNIMTEIPPQLANGGIATGAANVVIGEGKYNEVVQPLGGPMYEGFIEGVSNAVVSAMSVLGNSSSKKQGDVIINVDGKQLARVMNPYIESEQRRSSTNLIVAT